jgi:hypothetical protein
MNPKHLFLYILTIVLGFASCRDESPPMSSPTLEDNTLHPPDLVRFENYFRFAQKAHESWSLKAKILNELSGIESDYHLSLTRTHDTMMQSLPGPEFHKFEFIRGYQVLDRDTSEVVYLRFVEEQIVIYRLTLCEQNKPRWIKNCRSLILTDSIWDVRVPRDQTIRFQNANYLTFKDSLGRRIIWGASLVPELLYPKNYIPTTIESYTYSVWGKTLDLR